MGIQRRSCAVAAVAVLAAAVVPGAGSPAVAAPDVERAWTGYYLDGYVFNVVLDGVYEGEPFAGAVYSCTRPTNGPGILGCGLSLPPETGSPPESFSGPAFGVRERAVHDHPAGRSAVGRYSLIAQVLDGTFRCEGVIADPNFNDHVEPVGGPCVLTKGV